MKRKDSKIPMEGKCSKEGKCSNEKKRFKDSNGRKGSKIENENMGIPM
jgi:hypothetical protein